MTHSYGDDPKPLFAIWPGAIIYWFSISIGFTTVFTTVFTVLRLFLQLFSLFYDWFYDCFHCFTTGFLRLFSLFYDCFASFLRLIRDDFDEQSHRTQTRLYRHSATSPPRNGSFSVIILVELSLKMQT